MYSRYPLLANSFLTCSSRQCRSSKRYVGRAAMENNQTANDMRALVLGATGGIGGELARQLRDGGWQVIALTRGLEAATVERDGIAWVRGDAMDREAVVN